MSSSSKAGRVRPSEVAADTKRNFIPIVKSRYSSMFPPYSILYQAPTKQLPVQRRNPSILPPDFWVEAGDPVMRAIYHGAVEGQRTGNPDLRIPFLCAANEKRPGGDWETGCAGYEEKLCRRSNLAATLSTPHPDLRQSSHYPIPSTGGILSNSVVVCRGPHDTYEKLDSWYDLPVVSVPPTRWPKLKDHGSKYSFAEERDMIREKIRGALRICLYNGYHRVVIGDFGLGNGYRNPTQELAEIWRDIFLFDPEIRGQFQRVFFVFEDAAQSTTKLILEEMERKQSKTSSSSSSSKKKTATSGHRGSRCSSSASSPNASSVALPTDLAIFKHVFSAEEIRRVFTAPDPRYGLDMITI